MKVRTPANGPFNQEPSFDTAPLLHNVGAAAVVDWTLAPAQSLLLSASCNVTSFGLPPGELWWGQLTVLQDGTGSHVPTIVGAHTPGGTPLTFSTAAGSLDIVPLFWDGANLFANPPGLAYS